MEVSTTDPPPFVNRAVLVRRDVDDEFFTDGYVLSQRYYPKYYFEDSSQELEASSDSDSAALFLSPSSSSSSSFECPLCLVSFDSASTLSSHTRSHWTACSSCHKVLSTPRLLSLHITERHDPFFVSRLDNSLGAQFLGYECLTDGCPSVFSSNEARSLHMTAQHGFPDWYSFHGRKFDKADARRRRALLRGADAAAKAKAKAGVFVVETKDDMLADAVLPTPSSSSSSSSCGGLPVPRSNAKAARSCKYYSTSLGCRLGSSCRFSHSSQLAHRLDESTKKKRAQEEKHTNGGAGMDVEEAEEEGGTCGDVDKLADEVGSKLKVGGGAPARISFGRRR